MFSWSVSIRWSICSPLQPPFICISLNNITAFWDFFCYIIHPLFQIIYRMLKSTSPSSDPCGTHQESTFIELAVHWSLIFTSVLYPWENFLSCPMATLHSWKLFLKHLAESLLGCALSPSFCCFFVDLWDLPSFYTNHVNSYLTQHIYPLFIDSFLFFILIPVHYTSLSVSPEYSSLDIPIPF